MPVTYSTDSAGPSTRRSLTGAMSAPTYTYTDYETLTKAELAAEAEARGLAKSGTKAELVARLEENDAA